MATVPVTLFYNANKNYSIDDGLSSISFDLLLAESHSFSNSVTTHTVEGGTNIDDHIQNNLFQGGITAVISNFSIKSGSLTSNRAQDAFDIFEKMWRRRQLVTIITGLKVYEDVVILGINTARNQAAGESLSFGVTFREFKKVSLKSVAIEATVNITEFEEPQDQQAAPNTNIGRTVPEETYTIAQLQGVPNSVVISVASGGVV